MVAVDKRSRIEHFKASNGAEIFRLPVEVFVGYIGYVHLVVFEGWLTLVDTGSGYGCSHEDLLQGLEQVGDSFGIPARLEEMHNIIITHGHIDHFGGLFAAKQHAPQARVAAHALTRPVLINFDERVLITRTAMEDFLSEAGVPAERRSRLLDLYMLGKRIFKPMPVDVTLHDGMLFDGCFHVIHVPGHAPGLIMLGIGDVLLTADHILPDTSVALAPESIMPYTGVGHYLQSLAKAQQVEGIRVALGGHGWPMDDYYGIVERTWESAVAKIEQVFGLCRTPRTIYEIATEVYGPMDGYEELLKIEQTGARVEYLNLRGLVMVDNLSALEEQHSPPRRYRCLDSATGVRDMILTG